MMQCFQCHDVLTSPVLFVPQMQYVFIFQALLEHYLYGDTELEVTSLESHLAKLYSPSPGAGCSGLEAEFKVCLCVVFFQSFSLTPSVIIHLHPNGDIPVTLKTMGG